MDYKNINIRNLKSYKGNTVPNQFSLEVEGLSIFQSYSSIVCVIDRRNNTITFGEVWDCSRTTSKYLNIFLDENGIWLNGRDEIRKAIKSGVYKGALLEFKVIYDEELQ